MDKIKIIMAAPVIFGALFAISAILILASGYIMKIAGIGNGLLFIAVTIFFISLVGLPITLVIAAFKIKNPVLKGILIIAALIVAFFAIMFFIASTMVVCDPVHPPNGGDIICDPVHQPNP